jgi:hypothetical protein
MSGFTTSNGKIYDPSGNVFVARGIDVMNGNGNPSAATLQADFPGINFVRLAIYNYDGPDSLASYVNDLTSHGIVVELENHNNNAGGAGGSQGTIFTGQALQQEQDWYSSVASYFKNNPNVWFGTNNEPSETDPNTGQMNAAMLSDWQKTTYDSVRNTGNNAPVLLEDDSWGPGNSLVGYKASDYAGMHNAVWDMHYYGWLSGYSTDQNTVTNTFNQLVNDTHAIGSADGTMPVLIGEYGNSTTGQAIDANGTQTVQAVIDSGLGSAAWAWSQGNPGDGLLNGSGGLSSYGQQVAAGIAKKSATSGSLPPPTTTPSAPPSAPGSIVLTGSTGVITDASGNTWTIKNGAVQMNGSNAGYSANVTEIAYVNGTVWQENASNQWWGWSNNGWNTGNGTTTSPLPAAATPSANDTIVKAGSTSAIVDAAGHKWTITSGGQVAVNGTADATTANVTELAYVNGKVWQENTANNWYSKTAPTDTWSAATTTSPLPAATTPTTPTTPTGSANDGSSGAPAGTPLLPTLLNGYAVRPSWKVAGVDYAVGVPSGAKLANPSTISMSGVSVNAASHTVTISGNNVTLSGYDFGQGGGWGINIAPGATNITIKNSHFLVGTNNAVPINAAAGSGNLTVLNSTFDGGNSASNAVWAMINYNGSGTFTAQYNAFLNVPDDAIDFNSGTMTTNVKYNVFDNLGTSPGSHPDGVQYVSVNSNNSVEAYNTIYQPNASGAQGIQLEAQLGSTLTNTTLDNNTIVAKVGSGSPVAMSYSVAVIQDPGGNNAINGATVANNYIDHSDAYGPFYPPSGKNLTFSGNVDMTTGKTIPAPAGTSSSPLPATTPTPPATPPATAPDTIVVTAGNTATPVTGSGTVSGDTFKLTSNGTVNATLGSKPTSVQFLGKAGANVTGGSAAAVVSATGGTNSFTAGSGFMDVTGGGGADAYTFTATSKFMAIEDFSAAKGDTLSIASSLQSGMQTLTDGKNTILAFGNGSAIDLHNVTAAPTVHWTT